MKDIDGIEKVLEVIEPHWNEIQEDFDRHNARFLRLAAADHQIIGRVLRAHLIIESFMNTFLPAYFGFEDFDELRLSFHQKAKLLPAQQSSAAFVRPGILQLNSIRNKFGHRLNHNVEPHEISAMIAVLGVARKDAIFLQPIDAIEAFAPVACAFLSLPPKHLQELFMKAFAEVRSYVPENSD